MYKIEIENLWVKYEREYILKNVSLQLKEKTLTAIIGPNGGGKSTLIKAILGIIPYQKGKIQIHSASPIGYVPQFTNFHSAFPITVYETVLQGTLANKKNLFSFFTKEDHERAQKILKKLHLFEEKSLLISELSGGQMQKCLIARALITDPEILILDEPTASIDPSSRGDIYGFLADLKREKTIILISHDTGSISSYVDGVACLNRELHYHPDGQVTEEDITMMYGCPIDLISHGVPHRVFPHHEGDDHHV